jgi:transcriptional regulator with XRE-family HTH domain
MQTPGSRIKQKREEAGFNQVRFARLIGISQSTLSDIEKGVTKMPSATVLHQIAKHLNVSPAWIMTGKEGQLETLAPAEADLVISVRTLTAEQQRAVYELVNSMKPAGTT